ncbi:MAG: hypothetical protein J6X31_07255 [Bacteroidales bacterium]|nr:hypothetical protein [Bacteroidales bacterium]
MKNCLLIRIRLLLCALLVLVGSSSCMVEPLEEMNADPPKGPRVYFFLQGTVFQGEGREASDVRVITKYCFDDIGAVPADTTYTDSMGQFSSYGIAYSDSMRVVAEDMTGTFAPDSVDLRLQLNIVNYKDYENLSSYIYEGTTRLNLK